ncbi:MAG: hypothetical protein R3B54_09925 [Bdellovibrionota bacterium]
MLTRDELGKKALAEAERLRGDRTELPPSIKEMKREDMPLLKAAQILHMLDKHKGYPLSPDQQKLLASYRELDRATPTDIKLDTSAPEFGQLLTLTANAGLEGEMGENGGMQFHRYSYVHGMRIAAMAEIAKKLPPNEREKFLDEAGADILAYGANRVIRGKDETVLGMMRERSYRPADYHPDHFDENGLLKAGAAPKALGSDWTLVGVAMPGKSGNKKFADAMRIFYWDGTNPDVGQNGLFARVAENWRKDVNGKWELESVEWLAGRERAPIPFEKKGEKWEQASNKSCAACHAGNFSMRTHTKFSTDQPWGRGHDADYLKRNGGIISFWHDSE